MVVRPPRVWEVPGSIPGIRSYQIYEKRLKTHSRYVCCMFFMINQFALYMYLINVVDDIRPGFIFYQNKVRMDTVLKHSLTCEITFTVTYIHTCIRFAIDGWSTLR